MMKYFTKLKLSSPNEIVKKICALTNLQQLSVDDMVRYLASNVFAGAEESMLLPFV